MLRTSNQKANLRTLVAALRSGEFYQTQGRLRRDGSYCCLGVGCELYSQKVGGFWDYSDMLGGLPYFVADYTGGQPLWNENEMPEPVASYFGLNQYEQRSLANMNDGGASFNMIADHIETLIANG